MKKVLIAIAVVVLLIASNLVQFFIQKSRIEKLTSEYDQQLSLLQATIDEYGPLNPYYEVTEGVYAGQEITASDIVPMKMPDSFIGEQFVIDSEELIGNIAKVDIEPGTPITKDMLMNEPLEDSLRDVDIVVCHYPTGIKIGDYVDIRLTMPYGQDYVVLSHIRIQEINELTFKVFLTEEQQHRYRSACVDYYLSSDKGTDLYMQKYIEPGVQEIAVETYSVSDLVLQCMLDDDNVIDKAYARIYQSLRERIDGQMIMDDEEAQEKISNGRGADKDAYASDGQTRRQEDIEEEEEEGGEDEEEYYDLVEDEEPVDLSSDEQTEEDTVE